MGHARQNEITIHSPERTDTMLRTFMMMLAAASLLAGCAAPPQDDTHYWQHPKMGLVKVDKTTHGIVVPR